MKLVVAALAALLAACAPDEPDDAAAETEAVPIGPGSDSSTLIPPDTPMTHREPEPLPAVPPDSLL
jgi:hypothetical protein